MKKQLIVGLVGLVYLVFCCAGLGFALAEQHQQVVHFVHVDGHSDEYHATMPGKSAIKAFFAKTPVKAKANSAQPVSRCSQGAYAGRENNPLVGHNYSLPHATGERILLHCSYLL